MPFIKVNDFDIFYEIRGQGFPLVMILGLGANVNWWGKYFLKELAKEFTIIIFDNRGTGKSEDPDEDFTVKMLAEDVKCLIDNLGFKHIIVFGHSMGGYIAQELTLNYNIVKKLILCSTSCGGKNSIPASRDVLNILEKSRKERSLEEIAYDNLYLFFSEEFLTKNPKLIEYAVKNMLERPISQINYTRQQKAIQSFNTCDRLRELKVATLILHGKKDILVPPENSKILNQFITNSKLRFFESSAHAPFTEEPNEVIKTLIEFLK
jgi:pimeloyl-ACP methyl ester carboxylesterase